MVWTEKVKNMGFWGIILGGFLMKKRGYSGFKVGRRCFLPVDFGLKMGF